MMRINAPLSFGRVTVHSESGRTENREVTLKITGKDVQYTQDLPGIYSLRHEGGKAKGRLYCNQRYLRLQLDPENRIGYRDHNDAYDTPLKYYVARNEFAKLSHLMQVWECSYRDKPAIAQRDTYRNAKGLTARRLDIPVM